MRSLSHFRPAHALPVSALAVLGLLFGARHAHARASAAGVEPKNSELAPEGTSGARTDEKVPEGLTASEWSSIRGAYEAGRHAAFIGEGGYQARNPGQHWLTSFDGCGFSVQPDAGGWMWGLQLERYGFAGAERDVREPQQVSAEGQRVSYAWDENLREWWINDTRGLEHGYTILERPAARDGGPLTITLSVRGDLQAQVEEGGLGVRFTAADGAVVVTYSGLSVFDAGGRSLPARFERGSANLSLSIDERAAQYPLTIDPIAQRAYLKSSNSESIDEFGYSVSVSGDTVVVGAPQEDSNATGVNGNQADNSAPSSGAAYVFVRSGTTWSQQAYLKASNTGGLDFFGYSVSVSDDTLVVGAPPEDSNATGVNGNQFDNSAHSAGAAYVFVRSGAVWSQQAYLKASNTEASDYFGLSVSVSGDTVVVSAHRESSNATGVNGNQTNNSAGVSGAVYVFVRNSSTWSQQAYLKASNTGFGDGFGLSVSVSGDTAVVGAAWESSNAAGVNGNQLDNSAPSAGAAYVFVRSGTMWSQQAYLKASNTATDDQFGSSVSISGDTVVVGATEEDSNAMGVNGSQSDNSASKAGAAYVFRRSGTTWSQEAYLKASNTGTNDQFGWSVSVSGDTVVVGAVYEDSNATGVNGNQADNSVDLAGAAYVFARSGTTWSQQAYIKASNTGYQNLFGTTVSVSGDTVVVGAHGEDSNATGVNGNQADTSSPDAGAAYIYNVFPGPSAFCLGDGTGAACPCANAGAAGHGCASSAFPGGAILSATGAAGASAGTDTLVLTATDMPGPGLFFQSNGLVGTPIHFGDGHLCAAVGITRLGVVFPTAAVAAYPGGLTPIPIHIAGAPINAGDTKHYQCWYRSSPGLCNTLNYNLTQGLSIVWRP